MRRFFAALIVTGLIIWGCTAVFNNAVSDPFGATTRTQIEADSQIQTTQLQTSAEVQVATVKSDAAVKIAETEADAQVQSTEAQADAVKVAAKERRLSNEAWASRLPVIFLILAVAGGLWITLYYRGRSMLILAQKGIVSQQRPILLGFFFNGLPFRKTENPEEQLARYAKQNNLKLFKRNGNYLLVDRQSNQVVKQLTLKS